MVTSIQPSQQAYQASDNQDTTQTATELQIALTAFFAETCGYLHKKGASYAKDGKPFPADLVNLMKSLSSLADNLKKYKFQLSATNSYLKNTEEDLNNLIQGKESPMREKEDFLGVLVFGNGLFSLKTPSWNNPYRNEENSMI
jgi:hypothetical protein